MKYSTISKKMNEWNNDFVGEISVLFIRFLSFYKLTVVLKYSIAMIYYSTKNHATAA